MTLPELITKHHLPCAYLADRLSIARGTFNNKLRGNKGAHFNHREAKLLKSIIKEMKDDFVLTVSNKDNIPFVSGAVRSERVDKGKKRLKTV